MTGKTIAIALILLKEKIKKNLKINWSLIGTAANTMIAKVLPQNFLSITIKILLITQYETTLEIIKVLNQEFL